MEFLLISILLIAVPVSVILLIFQKQIRIALVRLKYGRYSYRYVNQFKKYANKSPFPYCFKDEIFSYLRLTSYKKAETVIYDSEKIILFEDVPTRLTFDAILRQYGKPDCFNAYQIQNKELRSWGYYKKLFGVEVQAVFFTLNENYVMGEYIIENSTAVDIDKFTAALKTKYGIVDTGQSSPFKIKGTETTSLLFYDNGFSALVRYYNMTDNGLMELIG